MKSRLELPREIRSLAVPLSRGARAALPALALAALLIAVSQFTASGSGRLSAGLGGGCTASVPDLVTDTGQSQSDNLTNDNTPAFQGTYSGLCNAITLYEGTTALGSDTSLAGGTWMINNSAQLGEGGHSVRARGSGRSSYSATLDVVIDTVAPVASVPDLAPASDTGTSNTDNTTHDTTPTFRGTAPGASRVFVRALVISSAGQSTGTLVVVGLTRGQWTATLGPLAPGSFRVQSRAQDLAGNSSLYGAAGELTLVIDPPPLCHGLAATIVGTSASESIVGTTGNDVIHSFGGNDSISARQGNDVICAGDGNDLIIGGPGADLVDGGQGVDRVSLAGTTSVDVNLATGEASGEAAGQDLFLLENVTGSSANDTLRGNFANNVLDGGDGHDILLGNTGNDVLNGGDGADQMNGNGHSSTPPGDICNGGPDPSGLDDSALNCEFVTGVP